MKTHQTISSAARLVILCVIASSLTSCADLIYSAWGHSYRRAGGYYDTPRKASSSQSSLPTAAEQLRILTSP
jgi:hypothetical protein